MSRSDSRRPEGDGQIAWRVRDKAFVWERPLGRSDGYRAILVRLDRIAVPELKELLVEAWLCRAPKRLATEYFKP